MPAADNHQDPRTQKPNWVDIWTLIVLAATLAGVWFYACEAHRMNKLTQKSVDNQTRPYLSVKFLPDQFLYGVSDPVDGRNILSVSFEVEDYGTLPATAEVRSVALYREGEVPVAELKKEPLHTLHDLQYVFISRSRAGGPFLAETRMLTDGELVDMRKSRSGMIAVKVNIRYGPKGSYETQECREFPLVVGKDDRSTVFHLGPPSGYNDPECNYLK